MKPTQSPLWKRIVYLGAFLVLTSCALVIWQRHDFCGGWADHYAALADELRSTAENPGLTSTERREHLIAAEWQEVISHKYAVAAQKPWRPYPSAPLLTTDEKRMVASKY
jgi:hypothetical protein